MIYTLTLNPAFDLTIYLKKLLKGSLNRSTSYLIDAAGKGINVSKVIKKLGDESIVLGFLGDENKKMYLKQLENYGLKSDFVFVNGLTRTNVKIFETNLGICTDINQKGFDVCEKNIDELTKKVRKYAKNKDIFIFSGSLPGNCKDDIYKILIKIVKEKGAIAILDAEGASLQNGLEAMPDVVKPNINELKGLFDIDENNLESIVFAAKKIISLGIKKVIVSMGEKGAVFVSKEDVFFSPAYKVEVKSTVGAGDAMVGAIAYSISNEFDDYKAFRLSCACAAAKVATKGVRAPEKDDIEKIFDEIHIQSF